MYKFILLLYLAGATLQSQSQDSVKFYYIGKVNLAESDSQKIAGCLQKEYKTVTLDINLTGKDGNTEAIYTSGNDYTWWKDSVAFCYYIPKALVTNIDSMVVQLHYHVACQGLDGNRGAEQLEADGSENTVKNINVNFISNPPGATVYLIPKLLWERNKGFSNLKNESLLARYIIYNGTTPVKAITQEYVYIALFKYNGKFIPVECSPTHFKPVDSVYANFTTK